MTRSMRCGPMPTPVAALDATGFDDVTNGYVPWSRSSSVAFQNRRTGIRKATAIGNSTNSANTISAP